MRDAPNGRRSWMLARRAVIVALVLLGCLALAASGGPPDEQAAPQAPRVLRLETTADSLLWIEIRNVTMHLDHRATIRVRRLRGQAQSTTEGQPAILDDRRSFSIQVTSGTVGLTGDDLTTLLNEFIFAYHGAPLKELRARPEGGR